ncbi:hypothetical protein [Helicobacter sp. 23-1045]
MLEKKINKSHKNLDFNLRLDLLNSFLQKGCTPRPAPPTRQKLPLFAFRGRASLNPLLAKNRRLHYCNLAPDFLHHEAGEIKGASHGLDFILDCHDSATQNLAMTKKVAREQTQIQKERI